MSFQAYIDNIKSKTGKTPEDFKKLAEKKGLLKPDVKAMANRWLAQERPRPRAWARHGNLRHLQRDEGIQIAADYTAPPPAVGGGGAQVLSVGVER